MIKILFIMLLFSGCSMNNINNYQNNKPELNFEHFFDGKLIAYGSVFDFFGRLDARFIIRSEKIDNPNYRNDNKVLYKQSIEYIDTKKTKEMISYAIFDKNNTKTLIYKDEMMTGEAKYQIAGNAANVRYDLKLEDKNMIVSADDWLYLVDQNHATNKITIKKFGIPVANIVMSIIKQN